MTFSEALQFCMPAIHGVYDEWLRQPEPTGVTCSKGCGTCCHYGLISSSSIEAFGVVVSWLGSGRTLENLAESSASYVQSYKAAVERLGHLPFSRGARRTFLKERLPCPLFVSKLDVSYAGHCGFYEFRPIICSQFHSTDLLSKCQEILPHSSDSQRMSQGEAAAQRLRDIERAHFGKSALGHLPLLLAALTTSQGLDAFLRVETASEDPQEQGARDFFFYGELLESVGLTLGARDFEDLERAQAELHPGGLGS